MDRGTSRKKEEPASLPAPRGPRGGGGAPRPNVANLLNGPRMSSWTGVVNSRPCRGVKGQGCDDVYRRRLGHLQEKTPSWVRETVLVALSGGPDSTALLSVIAACGTRGSPRGDRGPRRPRAAPREPARRRRMCARCATGWASRFAQVRVEVRGGTSRRRRAAPATRRCAARRPARGHAHRHRAHAGRPGRDGPPPAPAGLGRARPLGHPAATGRRRPPPHRPDPRRGARAPPGARPAPPRGSVQRNAALPPQPGARRVAPRPPRPRAARGAGAGPGGRPPARRRAGARGARDGGSRRRARVAGRRPARRAGRGAAPGGARPLAPGLRQAADLDARQVESVLALLRRRSPPGLRSPGGFEACVRYGALSIRPVPRGRSRRDAGPHPRARGAPPAREAACSRSARRRARPGPSGGAGGDRATASARPGGEGRRS